jgi:hypothetical protein
MVKATENTVYTLADGSIEVIYTGEDIPDGATLWIAPTPVAPPPLTLAQVQALIESEVQTYIDSKAKAKGYDSTNSCISYLNSTNATWKADAVAMNAWRDAVWDYCYTNAASATPSTTFAQLQPLLPTAPW